MASNQLPAYFLSLDDGLTDRLAGWLGGWTTDKITDQFYWFTNCRMYMTHTLDAPWAVRADMPKLDTAAKKQS